MFIYIKKEIEIISEPSKNFETKLNDIINISKDLFIILKNNSCLVNLSYNENYISNIINNNSIEEIKRVNSEIMNEIDLINAFISKYRHFEIVKNVFDKYRKQLEN